MKQSFVDEKKQTKETFVILKSDICVTENVKGALSGLRQFLTPENPLKRMKNAFYFTPKAIFVLKIFKVLS